MDQPYAFVLQKRPDGHITLLKTMSGRITLTEQAVNKILESEISKIRTSD